MKRALSAITTILAGLLLATVAFAGDDMTSLSYISYLERSATVRPAHAGDILDVSVNMPILAGDRLDTARGGRVEVQLADGSTLWLDEFTTVDFDAIALSRDDTAPRTALYLADGTAAIEIPATAAGDGSLRFESPAGAIFLDRPGLYRLTLRGNEIRVQAHSGFAELPSGVGSEILRSGEEAVVGQQEGGIERASISDDSDDFWNWVQERRHVPAGATAQYVGSTDSSRAVVLDAYGDWVYVPTFSSWMWQPRVSAGWVPYSSGRWYWTPVGWSWISYEPWGWYPFHYGSWYLDASFGWVWGFDSVWGPAWVDWLYSPGYVGWCPRGYYDWWYYRNGGQGRGEGWGYPRRWSEASFNFSGRVSLGQIDPRPWTLVPSGQFLSSHIDRVRLDSQRFLRGGEPARLGFVRSGPLVTSFPGRAPGDGAVESFFRQAPSARDIPDLSSIMGREPITGRRSAMGVPNVSLTSTTEVTRAVRSATEAARLNSSGAAAVGRWSGRDVPGPLGAVPGSGGNRTDVRRGLTTDRGSNPPVVRREVVHRDGSRPNSRDTGQSIRSQGEGTSGTSPRTMDRPSSPPAERPHSNFSSWVRDTSPSVDERNLGRVRDSWGSMTTRRDVGGLLAGRSYAAEPRGSTRSAVRSFSAERTQVHSTPVRSTTSHATSHSGSASRGSSSTASHSRRP